MMNLQALYDLKERLEHAAIAGTGLLHEDFRLRRALEALAPLAKANPVFARISAGTAALLNAPEQERSTALLDVLSLVDAVVYTQGVSNLSGAIEALEPGSGSYVQASYGQLQPLLSALSGTGSGRIALIRDCWENHPEYFGDFRVLPHVVGALKDNYTELADMIEQILQKQGAGVIPMLKADFDPAGKGDMARRIRVIANLAGEKENDWFISVLPESRKGVREAIIQTLSLSKENNQLLLDLCQTEKGKLKEEAMRALAAMDTAEAAAFWKKEIARKPNTVSCLKGVGSMLAADLAAMSIRSFLENILTSRQVYDQDVRNQMNMLAGVLQSKYSTDVDSLWDWIAEKIETLAVMVPDKNVRYCDFSIADFLQRTLIFTILWNPSPDILAMARRLGRNCREWFLGCAMLADMAEVSSAELYERYAPYIVRTGLLKSESKAQRNHRIQIFRVLSAVRWSQKLHSFIIVFGRFDPQTGNLLESGRKLDGIDPRWIELLTDPKINQDGTVFNLLQPEICMKADLSMDSLISGLVDGDNTQNHEIAGKWIYQRILETGNLDSLIPILARCGWKNWRGIIVHSARKNGTVSFTQLLSVLRLIPLSNQEKAADLTELDKLVESKEIKAQYGLWPRDVVLRMIAILETDPNAEI